MITTIRLLIVDKQPEDDPMAELQDILHPELRKLDPAVGKTHNPVFYSIFTTGDRVHIGLCCLYNLTDSSIELGVRIFLPEYWNQGYGSEIVNALCEYVFRSYPRITSVLAKTPAYNTRAIACYEKCKFVRYSRVVLSGYDMVFMARSREVNL